MSSREGDQEESGTIGLRLGQSSEEEKASVNPVKRRTAGYIVEENFIRTIPPIKAITRSPTLEEEKITVKELTATAIPLSTPVQVAPTRGSEGRGAQCTHDAKASSSDGTIKGLARKVIRDESTRDLSPAVPATVMSREERRRLEDEYVEKQMGQPREGIPDHGLLSGPGLELEGGHPQQGGTGGGGAGSMQE